MKLFGAHRVSYESIRRSAIECHALDTAAIDLLIETTVNDPERVRLTYEEMFSERLLALAIGIRTKLYQGAAHQGTERYVMDCGFLFAPDDHDEIAGSFSLKDICDKIIHARNVSRNMRDGTRQPITTLTGELHRVPWRVEFSTSLFCEGVLNWIRDEESAS